MWVYPFITLMRVTIFIVFEKEFLRLNLRNTLTPQRQTFPLPFEKYIYINLEFLKMEDDFEETVKKYDMEGTPAVISGRASITDLTLSDDEDVTIDKKPTENNDEVKDDLDDQEDLDDDSSDDDEILENLLMQGSNSMAKKPNQHINNVHHTVIVTGS